MVGEAASTAVAAVMAPPRIPKPQTKRKKRGNPSLSDQRKIDFSLWGENAYVCKRCPIEGFFCWVEGGGHKSQSLIFEATNNELSPTFFAPRAHSGNYQSHFLLSKGKLISKLFFLPPKNIGTNSCCGHA